MKQKQHNRSFQQAREPHKERIAKKILKKIGIPTCLIFFAVAVILGLLVRSELNTANEKELTMESQSAANELNAFFQKYLQTVSNLAVNPEVLQAVTESDAQQPMTETEIFSTVFDYMVNMQQADSENVLAIWIGDIDANSLTQSDGFASDDTFEITAREWYAAAVNQQAMLTKPYIDASTGQLIVSAAAPIIDPQTKQSIGVAGLDLALTQVSEVLSKCTIGDTGYVFMLYSDGTIVYHPNDSMIEQSLLETNLSDNAKALISSGTNGFVKYTFEGTSKYGYISMIGDTSYIAFSSLTASEFSESLLRTISIMVIIFALGIAFIFFAIKTVAFGITKPIEELDAAAKELADGNLDVQLTVTSNDEIGALGNSIQRTVQRLKVYISYIDEISAVLAQMASGKLVISLKQDYSGEFQKVKDALLHISAIMTELLTSITESSNQVSAGADDLATASQSLAEGSTTQASSVDELVSTAEHMIQELRVSRDDALNCAKEVQRVTAMAEDSKAQMTNMLRAMQKINETSDQVVGIIHTIEAIAEQTNLLSLNASIEAARAGDAGRGFAVVASEIGALANQSSESAASTKQLIELSITEIQKGVALAGQVTETLETVVTGIEQVDQMVTHTAELSVQQEQNMKQMQEGIDYISHAVQDTAATAQESSATSEELAAQSTVLAELVQRFDLRN